VDNHVAQPGTATPLMDGVADVGTLTTYARNDHVHPSDTSRLALSGGTLTGPLILAADPVAALGAATKQYVDNHVGGGGTTTIAPTPPASPAVGSLWWDSNGGNLYINYNDGNSTQWVPTTNTAATTGVSSFNTRTGAVTLQAADVTGVGGALLASPTFSGVVSAPTPTAGDNSTKVATTAFVIGQASSTTPLMDGTAATGVGTTWARADHVHPTDTTRAPLASPTFTGVVTIPGGASIAGYATTAQLGSYLPTAGGTLTGNLNGTTASFTGNVYMGQAISNGAAYFNYSTTTNFYAAATTTSRTIQFDSGYNLNYYITAGTFQFYGNNTVVFTVDYLGNVQLPTGTTQGNFTVAVGNGFKPGGGAWAATSDDRVKRDVVPYQAGLAEVLRLDPIRYRYNGMGGTTDDGRNFVGLSAQATRHVMPDMVFDMSDTGPADLLDGQLGMDMTALPLALVNAIKELTARLATLENRPMR
jgi:hypothetical protein